MLDQLREIKLEPSALLTKFAPEDPDRAGCLIEVEGFERAPSGSL